MMRPETRVIDPAPDAVADMRGAVARIGPNAVTQLVVALGQADLQPLSEQIFAAAGVSRWLGAPPSDMTDERQVGWLHRAVRAALPPAEAASIMAEAGRLTADYLLAARIPRAAQYLLRRLPAPAAAFLLVRAIQAHAWTFAGSGHFAARPGRPASFELIGNPLCAGEHAAAPLCVWHTAVFQRLFAALVRRDVVVEETACEARGDDRCRFSVRWLPARGSRRFGFDRAPSIKIRANIGPGTR